MTSSLAKHLVFKKPYGMTKNMMPTSTEQNWFFLCRENSGVHLADRGSQYLQRPVLQNGKKLFRCLSHVGHADFFDRFKISSTNLPAVCAIISFTGTRLTFVFVMVWTNFTTKDASPLFLFAAPPPAGGGGLACRRSEARYFSRNYFTLTAYLHRIDKIGKDWLY